VVSKQNNNCRGRKSENLQGDIESQPLLGKGAQKTPLQPAQPSVTQGGGNKFMNRETLTGEKRVETAHH